MKKLLIAAVAASVAATGFAGSYAAPAAKPAASSNNAYVEAGLGYALTDYDKFQNTTATSGMKHNNGGFAFAIDAGYNFMPHLGVEAGFVMPFQKPTVGKNKVTQYGLYGAGRLSTQVADGFNVFALAGVGYTHQDDKIVTTNQKDSAFGFLGGFGGDYAIPGVNGLTVGAKYLRFAGRNKKETTKATFAGPQYFLVTLGYQISM